MAGGVFAVGRINRRGADALLRPYGETERKVGTTKRSEDKAACARACVWRGGAPTRE